MLVRPGNDRPFPENDLSYLTFITTAYQNFHRLEQLFDNPIVPAYDPDVPHGFLDKVPILSHLPTSVQIDLLAEVWTRHYSRRVYQANLLDAAVIYAACREVVETFATDPSLVRMYLEDATRDLDIRLDDWTRNRLETLYEHWWSTFEPWKVHRPLDLEGYPLRMVTPLEEARDVAAVSSNVEQNLRGLVTPAEIRHYVPLLTRADILP